MSKALRQQCKDLDTLIRHHLDVNNHCVDWQMDSGQVVLKKNGDVKLSYSVRSTFADAKVVKQLIIDFLAMRRIAFKRIVTTNMLEEYRSEVRITLLIDSTVLTATK